MTSLHAKLLLAVIYGSLCLGKSESVRAEDAGAPSLIEAAPQLYNMARRQYRFFGDDSTVSGSFGQRSFLLGDLEGDRSALNERGVYLDAGLTQFFQGNLSGGADDSPDPRYSGSADVWMWLDTGKAGWWGGGALFAHFEANWATSINKDAGALLPPNFDATMPAATNPPNATLSELYLLQEVAPGWMVTGGKMDFAAWADTNLFANNERSQFNYTGLVNNPIAGLFFPYTALMASLSWSDGPNNIGIVWSQSDSQATNTGFDNLFNSDNTYAAQYTLNTELGGKPGSYYVAAALTTKDLAAFDYPRRYRISQGVDAITLIPAEEDENYGVIANFSQYLWVKDSGAVSTRYGKPVGIGVFARAGVVPEDRNVFDQFYSVGIGGYGMLIPGRDEDNWGIGYAGTHVSDDFRDLEGSLREWEHAVEVFYNFSVTPAIGVSVNGQAVRTPFKSNNNTAYTLGARLQVDL